MSYRLIIFDMDGTILDTLDDLKNSLNYALACNHLPSRNTQEVRSMIGNGIRRLVELGVPAGASLDVVDQVFADFKPHYDQHCLDLTRPYPGIMELLKELKAQGYKLAVVSNKADSAVQSLSQRYFADYFDISVGERPDVRKKPFPDSVNQVMKELDIAAEDTLYVGDSEVDVETCQNANLDLILVDWGFRDRKILLTMPAKTVISIPDELLQHLKKAC
ncbi:MAG: HAD-IIIA family hydrolase [Erysipelotrichaceae bacterium]|nr:HAD-IIIA family hydrolase [Erysipelotrichaceae bacterium]